MLMQTVQSAEKIANYFALISQEFNPVSLDFLPPNICEYLTKQSSLDEIPQLSDLEVYKKLRSAKKPLSSVGRDTPVKIVRKFQC